MISIIVPVYNAEERLDRCIQSVLCQSYDNWELLLVNDGSLDKSGNICEDWSKKDKRIKVFHKKNGGVSSARNLGLDKATGEWITFIDADDSIERETLEKCACHFEKADVIRFSMKYIYSEDGKEFKDFVLPVISHNEYLSRIVARETILGVCAGIYQRHIFVENNIRFDESLVNGEDWVVLLQLVLQANNLAILPDTLYLYNKTNENSCTYKSSFKKSYSAIKALDKICEMLKKDGTIGFEKSISRAKCELAYNFYANIILRSYKVSKEEINKYSNLIGIARKDIWEGTHSLKERVILLCFSSRVGIKVLESLA